MLDSLADAVRDTVRKKCEKHPTKEGRSEGGWLVLDIGDIVVHLFSPDQRDYYDLEQLWSHGKTRLHLT
jgi:ribosome-associated protein